MNTVQEKVMNSDIIIPKFVLLSPAVLVYVIQFAYKSIFIPEIISQSKEKEKKKKINLIKKSKRVTFIYDTKSLLHNLRHAVLGPRFPL